MHLHTKNSEINYCLWNSYIYLIYKFDGKIISKKVKKASKIIAEQIHPSYLQYLDKMMDMGVKHLRWAAFTIGLIRAR